MDNRISTTRRILPVMMIVLTAIAGRYTVHAQEGSGEDALTQVVRGSIVDAQTRQPLAGVTVAVVGAKLGAISTSNGAYRIANVPVGRQTLRITSVGYEPITLDIVVTSGRQVVADIELQERVVRGQEVVVVGGDPFKTINETALISANAFSVDDVLRYAGSREDPARMAQNFAGVLGSGGIRNDIVIRGGSPVELLWRFDGIDIPNPNHFATQGATGGPVNTINANLLANSDFLTGAFPAEYGGKLSGVFDLRTRRGNTEQHEFVAQMGFNGFEGMIEGPIPGIDGSSFIASYRKSTLQVFDALGIDLGLDAVPKYEDATVKVDLPIGESDRITLTALGGISDIGILASRLDSVFTGDVDLTNGTDLGVVGVTWQRLFSHKLVGRLWLTTVNSRYRTTIDSLTTDTENRVLDSDRWFEANNTEDYVGARYTLSYAVNPSNYFTFGLEGRSLGYDIDQRRLTVRDEISPDILLDADRTAQAFGFVSWNWRPTEELTVTTGMNGQYLGVSRKSSIEPRFAISYALAPAQSVNAGFGIHRQAQPLLVYFGTDDNRTLDFTQALHYVVGYTNRFAEDWMLKIEGYYKEITDVPVDRDSATAYSLLNEGTNFGSTGADRNLANGGKGWTHGAELTLTKRFTDGYYVTATGSYVRQEYAGSDGVRRYGAFDNRYIANLLLGYEWKVNPGFTVEFGGKYTIAGGAPYTPVDLVKSRMYNSTYFDNGQRFSLRNPDYSRLDVRVDFRNNFGSWSMIGYISVENILDRRNVQERQYSARYDRVEVVSQIGIFPVGGIRFEF